MNSWANFITVLTLFCYLAVSSTAAVHAFPITAEVSAPSLTSSAANAPLSDCHTQSINEGETQNKSSCQIFCAALSNFIIDDVVLVDLGTLAQMETTFIADHSPIPTLAQEPRPPQQTLTRQITH